MPNDPGSRLGRFIKSMREEGGVSGLQKHSKSETESETKKKRPKGVDTSPSRSTEVHYYTSPHKKQDVHLPYEPKGKK